LFCHDECPNLITAKRLDDWPGTNAPLFSGEIGCRDWVNKKEAARIVAVAIGRIIMLNHILDF
jgi:hypothetical protein